MDKTQPCEVNSNTKGGLDELGSGHDRVHLPKYVGSTQKARFGRDEGASRSEIYVDRYQGSAGCLAHIDVCFLMGRQRHCWNVPPCSRN